MNINKPSFNFALFSYNRKKLETKIKQQIQLKFK